MPETITAIVEIEDTMLDQTNVASTNGFSYEHYAGYKITTTEQDIWLLMANEQDCCEVWGYFFSQEDPDSFVGAELISVSIIENDDDKLKHLYVFTDEDHQKDAVFVNLDTDRGLLQFTAYNSHNGYYGHRVHIHSRQVRRSFKV